jgi:predicted regulator of Ras-like GTPase activity (Roadblock/LC7/MglB family)
MDTKTLHTTLTQLKGSDPHVVSVSVVSPDGLILASTHTQKESAELIGAMVSEVLQKSHLALEELRLGKLISTLILGTSGGVIAYSINEEMILAVEVKPQVHLGNLFRNITSVVQRFKEF